MLGAFDSVETVHAFNCLLFHSLASFQRLQVWPHTCTNCFADNLFKVAPSFCFLRGSDRSLRELLAFLNFEAEWPERFGERHGKKNARQAPATGDPRTRIKGAGECESEPS
jgi:hypothetical protein